MNDPRTPSGGPLTDLILQVFPLHGQLGAAGDELTKPWGLSSARWKVLGAIANSDRPLHVAQIARNMGQSRQAVQRIVNELVGNGLLTLNNNPDHERARLVSLTKRGRGLYQEIMTKQARWSNELAEGISPRSLHAAARILSRLVGRLENLNRKDY